VSERPAPWPAAPTRRGIEILEGLQRSGEVVPQPQGVPGPVPDQRLVGTGQDLERLGAIPVAGHRPQLVGVGADHVGQHVRVTGVALGTRNPQPVPEPGRLQRVDRKHRVPGRDRRHDPRPRSVSIPTSTSTSSTPASASAASSPIILCNRAIPVTPSGSRAFANRRPAASIPSTSWWSSAQSSPTNSLNAPPTLDPDHRGSQPENHQRPNRPVLTPPKRRARHPSSDSILRAIRRGHGLSTGLNVQVLRVLTHRRLPPGVCRTATPEPIRCFFLLPEQDLSNPIRTGQKHPSLSTCDRPGGTGRSRPTTHRGSGGLARLGKVAFPSQESR
jgi:hypothetical protein